MSFSGSFESTAFEETAFDTSTETLRYALVELDDTQRKEGRLLSFGDVEHALSDAQGNLEAATVNIHGSDLSDRPIGTRLAGSTTKFFQRDVVDIFAISDAGRRTAATPRRIMRALLQEDSYGTPVEFTFQGLDPFFCDGGAFGPDKTFPMWKIPPYYVNAPQDVYNKIMPVILGEKSDEGATDPVTNLSASRGECSLTFVGMDGLATGAGGAAEVWGRFNLCLFAVYKVLSLYGSDLGGGIYGIANATSNGATPSVITLGGGLDLSLLPVDGTAQLTLYTAKGVVTSQITAVDNVAKTVTVNNTIATADATNVDWVATNPLCGQTVASTRAKIDLTTRNGVDVMVPKWPNYVRSTVYEDIMGSDGEVYRVTDIWVRGPLLDAHLNGSVTLAANVLGVEDQGDGTGLPITDYFMAYYWWLINCVMVNTKAPGGIGFVGKWPQTDGDIAAIGAAWADGTYKVRGSSFVTAQAISAIKLGGRGYQVSAYFGEATSLRDAVQLWNDNGGCRLGVNEHGQVLVSLFDETADPSTWPRVEHVSRVFGDVTRTNPQTEMENVVQGRSDWDGDGNKFRNGTVVFPSASGISHNKGIRKLSKVIDGKLTANVTQWATVLQSRLAYAKDGPVYVTFTGDVGLLDYRLGSGIQFTSIMGPGALGYIDQPLIILKKRFGIDSHLVTYTCLDVGGGSGMGLLVAAAQQFLVTDDTATAPTMSDSDAIAPVVSV